jgi:hypothetical protein
VYDPCASASLRIESVPEAHVWIDGRPYESTPLDIELSPGKHDISLRAEGFRPHESAVSMAEGGRQTLEVKLVSDAGSTSQAVAALARSIGLTPTEFHAPRLTRGGMDTRPVQLLWPKGKVRCNGLSSCAIEVDETFDGDAWIVFRCDGEEVSRERFDPLKLRTVQPLPDVVIERAEPGTIVTWGVWDEGADEPTASATVEVVACRAAGRRLKRIGTDRLLICQPDDVRCLLAIHTLLDQGLDSEALVIATEACADGAGACEELHRAMLETLRRTDNEHSLLWAAAWHSIGARTPPGAD